MMMCKGNFLKLESTFSGFDEKWVTSIMLSAAAADTEFRVQQGQKHVNCPPSSPISKQVIKSKVFEGKKKTNQEKI